MSSKLLPLSKSSSELAEFNLPGSVNRENGLLAASALSELTEKSLEQFVEAMNRFPGLSRRFEKIADNLYSDYAHTPEKIAGCLQRAHEQSDNIVVVYEPLTNRRQYFIKDSYSYRNLFDGVKKLYWVPSYLTREDPNQPVLTPEKLITCMDHPEIAEPAELNEALRTNIEKHRAAGDLVVVISGGGGGSLDEWLRQQFAGEQA